MTVKRQKSEKKLLLTAVKVTKAAAVVRQAKNSYVSCVTNGGGSN